MWTCTQTKMRGTEAEVGRRVAAALARWEVVVVVPGVAGRRRRRVGASLPSTTREAVVEEEAGGEEWRPAPLRRAAECG